jgi:MFS family permease
MTVGIPGTGIGGLFYIAAALAAPFRRSARKKAAAVAHLGFLGLAVLSGIFVTGWLLGFVLGPAASTQLAEGTARFSGPESENIVRWASLLASILLLAAVLLAVQLARLIQKKR